MPEFAKHIEVILQENQATIDRLRAQLCDALSPTKSRKGGTAYVEVRPDFTAFDAAVERAVQRAEQKLARIAST